MSSRVLMFLHGGARNRRMLQLFLFCAISIYLLQGSIFKMLNYMTYSLRRYQYEQRELIQIQVVFRHGHRTPFSIYPTDPNPAEVWKSKLGTLSQLGKLQHYIVGEYLRNMYAGFVTSNVQEVHCLSSVTDRCLYGAYALLAGMYPPSADRLIQDQLLWQPVLVEYPESPDMMFQILKNCPEVEQEQLAITYRDIGDFLSKSKVLYEFWTNKSGKTVESYIDAGNLFKTLLSEKAYNLTIPDWAQETWDQLREQADLCYYFHLRPRLTQGLRIGNLYRRILEKWKEQIANLENSKKVYLYSGHGTTIACVLLSLQIFNMKSPPYCSFISFELYREQGHRHTIRVLFSNSSNPEVEVLSPRAMVLPGCTEYCPFEFLEEYIRDLVEKDWAAECPDDDKKK